MDSLKKGWNALVGMAKEHPIVSGTYAVVGFLIGKFLGGGISIF